MLTYFVGFFLGIYAVLAILQMYPDYAIQALIALFSYIGAPTATTIGFYAWKAKNENMSKHKSWKANETDTSSEPVTYFNSEGE